ncbi:hypothetical protein EQZ23_10200 [Sphingomonas sp. UV9]|uniref:hypothetical protein n=1 Tax=Sphingomonas sp. UV9 TaxID=1851410 RepID=UPI000FFB21FD|nr:hypothetical protein [Sphingomonas sp. UV9]RXD05434.1 hypothetical protein EQZ23_10200 [Sphingomonas sp. UV9]
MRSKGRTVRAALAGIVGVGIGLSSLGTTQAVAQESAPAREFVHNAAPADLPDDRIERFTGDLRGAIGQWTGVRSCSRARRATEARKAAYERWIGQQTLARRGKTLLVAGVGPGQWRFENRRTDGRRSCKGWYQSAPAYAHFY